MDNMKKSGNNSSLPQYRIILKNDDKNSLDKVITALIILCGLDPTDALQKVMDIHMLGDGVIKTAHFELAETIMIKLNNLGLQSYIEKDLI